MGSTVRYNKGLKGRTQFSNVFATTDGRSGMMASTMSFMGNIGGGLLPEEIPRGAAVYINPS